jgi:hypothetical protein
MARPRPKEATRQLEVLPVPQGVPADRGCARPEVTPGSTYPDGAIADSARYSAIPETGSASLKPGLSTTPIQAPSSRSTLNPRPLTNRWIAGVGSTLTGSGSSVTRGDPPITSLSEPMSKIATPSVAVATQNASPAGRDGRPLELERSALRLYDILGRHNTFAFTKRCVQRQRRVRLNPTSEARRSRQLRRTQGVTP